jgi:ribonuclease P protein component
MPWWYTHELRRPSRVEGGFVVSKAVGNAVTRNRVKRQLRHLVAGELAHTPIGVAVVVRALPPAAPDTWPRTWARRGRPRWASWV